MQLLVVSTTITDVKASIAAVLDNKMRGKHADSNFFGVLTDESTDISVNNKMRVPDGKAETLVSAIKKELQNSEIELRQLVGLGSDGAPVMTGRNTVVDARLLQRLG